MILEGRRVGELAAVGIGREKSHALYTMVRKSLCRSCGGHKYRIWLCEIPSLLEQILATAFTAI